jgi:hypothetical protein
MYPRLVLSVLLICAACTDNRTSDRRDAGRTNPGQDAAVVAPDAGTREDAGPEIDSGTTCTRMCSDRECGDDGCSGSCGECSFGDRCSAAGRCECTPTCGTAVCGDNGCGGSCGECTSGDRCEAGRCVSDPAQLEITEVFYDAVGADGGLEWVEIHNAGSRSVDLSGYSLGAGGTDYTYSVYALTGVLAPGDCYVVGGPTSSDANSWPLFGQAQDFTPDLQNADGAGDGVALFASPAASITTTSVPIDAVVYGADNASGLLGPTGSPAAAAVANVEDGGSIERTAFGWRTQLAPSPNDCSHAL